MTEGAYSPLILLMIQTQNKQGWLCWATGVGKEGNETSGVDRASCGCKGQSTNKL